MPPSSASVYYFPSLGHLQPVDICSVANANRLVSWSFNSHFGFFASLLWYMKKYAVLGEKRIEAAVVKMLSKHKYRLTDFSDSIYQFVYVYIISVI